MILLLGASGTFGKAFAVELRRRGHSFIPLTRQAFDYTRFDYLFDYLRTMTPAFLINAAGCPVPADDMGGGPSREQGMLANALLPQMIARVCLMTRIPWAHLSSGSIYTGAKIMEDNQWRVETDLSREPVRRLFQSHPENFRGFTELDEPNLSFRSSPGNFFSATKALAEEAIRGIGQCYIWRPRLVFSDSAEPASFLSQFQRWTRIPDTIDSLSHLEDCVRACLDLWERRAPFGIYNVTNPGAVTTRHIAELMQRILKPSRPFEFWTDEENRHRLEGKPPPSHCILDSSKLLAAGVKMRALPEALEEALRKIRKAERMARKTSATSPSSQA